MAPSFVKILIIVDDDFDIGDHFQVEWAMCFRMQPARDVEIVHDAKAIGLDPSQAAPEVPQEDISRYISSKLVINATRKHAFPALALPPKAHLEIVDKQWEKYGFSR